MHTTSNNYHNHRDGRDSILNNNRRVDSSDVYHEGDGSSGRGGYKQGGRKDDRRAPYHHSHPRNDQRDISSSESSGLSNNESPGRNLHDQDSRSPYDRDQQNQHHQNSFSRQRTGSRGTDSGHKLVLVIQLPHMHLSNLHRTLRQRHHPFLRLSAMVKQAQHHGLIWM